MFLIFRILSHALHLQNLKKCHQTCFYFDNIIKQTKQKTVSCKYKLQLSTYVSLLQEPVIFLQLSPLPPHTPHLSTLLLDPITWSQPAFTHWPWTHTEVVSGPQVVPSITCFTGKKRWCVDKTAVGLKLTLYGQNVHGRFVFVFTLSLDRLICL